MYIVQCIVYSMQCTVYIVQCKVYSMIELMDSHTYILDTASEYWTHHCALYNVSLLGQDEGCRVKYSPSPVRTRMVLIDRISLVAFLYGHYISFKNQHVYYLYCPPKKGITSKVDFQYFPLWEGNISMYTPSGLYFTIYTLGQILDILCTGKYTCPMGQYWNSKISIFYS